MLECEKCGADIFPSEYTPYLTEAKRCRKHYTGSWKGGINEFLKRREHLEGASPERMEELQEMKRKGTLAAHCRQLLHKVIDSL